MTATRKFWISDEAFSQPTIQRRKDVTWIAWRQETDFSLGMNENNITHNKPTSLLSARLPAYSISLTTKTVSPDLASDVHSKLDTSVWLSITSGLFGMPAAPLFLSHSRLLFKENNSGVINHRKGREAARG